MLDLVQIMTTWVKHHPELAYHFHVNYLKNGDKRGFIAFACNNEVSKGSYVDIFDSHVVWYNTKVKAADPTLFTQLESFMKIIHDRAAVTNTIMFRSHCDTKLHKCVNKKVFCGC